jgi:hypothetical protein
LAAQLLQDALLRPAHRPGLLQLYRLLYLQYIWLLSLLLLLLLNFLLYLP